MHGRAYQQNKEGAEGRAVVEELHEGATKQLTDPAERKHPVVARHERHGQDEAHTDEELGHARPLPPAGQPLVPDAGQELLAVGVRHELSTQHTHVR